MTNKYRLVSLILIDSIIVFASIYFSYFILLPTDPIYVDIIIISSISLLVTHHVFAYRYKLYKRALGYASIGELISTLKIISFSILITGIIQLFLIQGLFIRTLILTLMLHIILMGGFRFLCRIFGDSYVKDRNHYKRALIVGAGSAGTMLVRQFKYSKKVQLYPVAFIDDDKKKQGLDMMGVPVVGGIDKLLETVSKFNIETILVAIPSLKKKELNIIVEECMKTEAEIKIMPMMEDILMGRVSVDQFRDVQVEDLLGREPVELDTEHIAEYITDKTIVVTGAGGSIGSEICRQISIYRPARVILLGHGENSIFTVELELKMSHGDKVEYITEIADIQDREKMFSIMDKYSPTVVFHAAAHKHVALMERNPDEAIKNNIIGTKNVAEAADHYKVETFVMISTDKAVNPTSVMGATKRISEMIIQHLNVSSKTKFVAVRFGNVLGSRGSVIPLFKEQIKRGGPVMVTHPDVMRYFMTIPEASVLVLQAGSLAKGGEIFVLDMGKAIRIVDLAKNLITLSGLTVEDIGIEYIGLRPGEKLFEELLNKNEVHSQQVHPKIYIGKSAPVDIATINKLISEFVQMDSQLLQQKLIYMANDGDKRVHHAITM
jgi:FlaA1/EpsC-like NDP-sugar epimerase